MERVYDPRYPNAPATEVHRPSAAATRGVAAIDWREELPVMVGRGMTLRSPQPFDAPSLWALLTTPDVTRFISRPPDTIDGFVRFIEWTAQQRAAGQYVCYAVVPDDGEAAVGLFQIRGLDQPFARAEWGFAIGSRYWGSGLFAEGGQLVVDFAFTHIGVHRLEARAVTRNARGNAALAKLGAQREAVLRHSFLKDGAYVDQNLWTIVRDDWRAKAVWGLKIH